jgi:hypothetical protein
MNKLFTSGPIDGSRFSAGLGQIHGARLLGIDYEAGIYRWQPIDAEGNALSGDVFGTNVDPAAACEIAADDHIRADIARTQLT